jgi:hypothetical protein
MHALATARSSTQQYQAAHELRFRKRYLLRDEAAKRETEDVHLRETKRLGERRRVGRHLLGRGRHLAARAGNARVVEQLTSRSVARPSVTAGSQWSIVPVKCWLKTSGTPSGLPKRR